MWHITENVRGKGLRKSTPAIVTGPAQREGPTEMEKNWKSWGTKAEMQAHERGHSAKPVEVDEAEVRRRIRYLEELLPTLAGSERAHGHYTLAALYQLAVSTCPEKGTGSPAEYHARAAVELDAAHAGAWRLMARAHIHACWRGSDPLPETSSATDRTYLYRETSPEDCALYRAAVQRREPLLQEALQCAARAVALGPTDERNEEVLDDAVAELRQLFDVKEALARAPAAGAGVEA